MAIINQRPGTHGQGARPTPLAANEHGPSPRRLEETTVTTTVKVKDGPSKFNDDAAEKRRRRSSIRSASEKLRRRSLQPRNAGGSGSGLSAQGAPGSGGLVVSTDAAFDSSSGSRVPIMANFEEWMKLVKENKINASNSWNFALIDYFHDMSVLKEGDGINFQKASFTLDGCVKIYTSRVDSVASETGKLLSGLADRDAKNGGRRRGLDDEEEGASDEEKAGENEEEDRAKRSKRKHRSENTLAKSFSQIQVKKLELELAVDPLFRKMCSDFNEGGAHSLLLNNLGIDSTGRVVFDGQADNQEEANSSNNTQPRVPFGSQRGIEPVDLYTIRSQFFEDLLGEDEAGEGQEQPAKRTFNLDAMDQLSLCPSLPMLEEMVKDPTATEKIIQNMEAMRVEAGDVFSQLGSSNATGTGSIMFGKAEHGQGGWDDAVELADGSVVDRPAGGLDGGLDFQSADPGLGGDYGDDAETNMEHDGDQDFDDMGMDLDFGEPEPQSGGAREAAEVKDEKDKSLVLGPVLDHAYMSNHAVAVDIMAYFDETLKSNWAGPEHWKIQKVKSMIGINKSGKSVTEGIAAPTDAGDAEAGAEEPVEDKVPAESVGVRRKRVAKQPVTIDFLSDEGDVSTSLIFVSGTAIDLPKLQRKSKTKNLLPVDEHFSSKELISIFLKPRAALFQKESAGAAEEEAGLAQPEEAVDERFFAQNMKANGQTDIRPDFGDAAYVEDDGYGYGVEVPDVEDDELAVREPDGGFGGGAGLSQMGAGVFGSKRHRPEYVSYAKSAKKVDVKLLKNNIWKVLDFDEEKGTRHQFSDIMGGLESMYPATQLRDISTSFCFISLLHLANEKGLVLESTDGNSDITITRDAEVLQSQLSV